MDFLEKKAPPEFFRLHEKVISDVAGSQRKYGFSKCRAIQATIPKENGYPTVDFLGAIDALGKQSLTPTLLLIDADEPFGSNVIKNQLALISKVKEMGGQILVCCRSGQTVNPALQAALADTEYTYYQINELNKLQKPELLERLHQADFVVVAGYDTNDCVRATIGARRDDGLEELSDYKYPNGMIQEGIPVLFSDECSQGKKHNLWEGSRFKENLFFWAKPNSPYRLALQAVKEYRSEKTALLPDFESALNKTKLKQIREELLDTSGLTTSRIKDLFRFFKIAPDNPLLDEITGASV